MVHIGFMPISKFNARPGGPSSVNNDESTAPDQKNSDLVSGLTSDRSGACHILQDMSLVNTTSHLLRVSEIMSLFEDG
jgi:hypothetical protein